MRTPRRTLASAFAAAVFGLSACSSGQPASAPALAPAPTPEPPAISTHQLPAPSSFPATNLTELLEACESTREYSSAPITEDELATLLWAAYGYKVDGGRTVPSAGAFYSLRLYVLVENVHGFDPGLYRYDPEENQVALISAANLRAKLQQAALDQASVSNAPLVIVITGNPQIMEEKYGTRADRFGLLEAGHTAQNLTLAAAALNLGLVTIGGFSDEDVRAHLSLPDETEIYYLIPVGHPR